MGLIGSTFAHRAGDPALVTDAAVPDADLIIKEARRRHRYRLIVGASIGLAVIAVGTGIEFFSSTDSHKSPAHLARPTATTAVPVLPALTPPCTAAQLAVQYRGSQGAAGNFASSFWVADTTDAACSLRSGMAIDLIDVRGATLAATGKITSPIELSANSSMPPINQNPPKGQTLGVVVVAWPTIANAALALGSTNGGCPQPLFNPRSARITFAGVEPIEVNQLNYSGVSPPESIPSICGIQLFVWDVGPLTAP